MADLARRATAEAIGTGLLVVGVVGSGIAAQRLTPDDVGLQLLENALATAGILLALLLALGPVSGAHLNPVVTLADRLLGGRSSRDAAAYVAAQLVGGAAGTVVANLMFDLPAVTASTRARDGAPLLLGEAVATTGLVLVVLGVTRSVRPGGAPAAVAGYIAGAYWCTSSTSFANPAVTVARSLTDTFAGIRPASVPGFVAVQLVAGLGAALLGRWLFPAPTTNGAT